jgi:hypothetical protein
MAIIFFNLKNPFVGYASLLFFLGHQVAKIRHKKEPPCSSQIIEREHQ